MTVVNVVNLTLSVVTLAIKGGAFVDAAIRPSAAFKAVDKLPKSFWVIVLGLAAGAQLAVALESSLADSWNGLPGLIGIVVALVYLFGIRPQVIQYGGRRKGGGRSSSDGPYGPW
jgi:Protein of unknown function (DUF2516)